jgi:Flp pilus assembly protein TadG
MKQRIEPKATHLRRRKGFVLLTMSVAAIAMLGALGLAVDMGRIFIVRNETQAFCDAAAVMAASYLDNASDGVQSADTAAKATAIKWNFGTTTVSSPTVEYGTTASGPWSNATAFPSPPAKTGCAGGVGNEDPACGYRFVRVKTSVSVPLYFLPVVQTVKTYNQTVNSQAIAGQVDISGGTPVAPYTGIAQSATGPNFGLTVGDDSAPCADKAQYDSNKAVGCYDIQWPAYNGKKFVSNPCGGDNATAQSEVQSFWGASYDGYWGATGSSTIAAETIDYQPVPGFPVVSPGTDIYSALSTGNKASQADDLDLRVNQDGDNYDTTYTAYLANTAHNGRRLLTAPIVLPGGPLGTAGTTPVEGFGLYFLLSNTTGSGQTSDFYKKAYNGNMGFCAMYVGPACVGCKSNGVGGTTGSAAIKLVQ